MPNRSKKNYPAKHLVWIFTIIVLLGVAVLLDNLFFDRFAWIDLIYAVPLIAAAIMLSPLEVVAFSILAMLFCYSAQTIEGDAGIWWSSLLVGAFGFSAALISYLLERWRRAAMIALDALESSPLAYAVFKFPGYRVISSNGAFREMVSVSHPHQIRGRRLADILPRETADVLAELLDHAISTRDQAQSRDFSILNKEGKNTYWNINAVPLLYRGQRTPRRISLIALNVTGSVQRARGREAALKISNAVMSSLDLHDTVKVVMDSLAYATGVNAGALFLLEDDQWVGTAGYGEYTDDMVKQLRLPYDDLQTAAEAVETKQALGVRDAASDARFSNERIRIFGIRSSLVTPLVSGNKVVGALWLNQTDHQRDFSDDQLDFATTVGSQAALAIDNAIVYENEHTMRKSLEAIEMVSEAGLTSLDLEEVLMEVVSRTQDVMQMEAAVIMLADEEEEYLIPRASAGNITSNLEPIRVGEGLVGMAYLEGAPMKIDDVHEQETDLCPFADTSNIRSVLAVPLRLGGKTAGVLLIGSQRVHGFSAREWGLIQVLADRASMAVQNSMLFDETKKQLVRAELLREVAAACAGSNNLNDIAEQALASIYRELGCRVASIFFYQKEQNHLVNLASMGYPDEIKDGFEPLSLDRDMLLSRAIKMKQLLTQEHEAAHTADEISIIQALKLEEDSRRATLPILYKGEVVGGLAMAFHDKRPFLKTELKAINSLADQLAVAFSKADQSSAIT